MVCGNRKKALALCAVLSLGVTAQAFAAPRQMENLSRGLVAANVGNGMLVSWRLLGSDAPNTEFNLYRDGTKIATIAVAETVFAVYVATGNRSLLLLEFIINLSSQP